MIPIPLIFETFDFANADSGIFDLGIIDFANADFGIFDFGIIDFANTDSGIVDFDIVKPNTAKDAV